VSYGNQPKLCSIQQDLENSSIIFISPMIVIYKCEKKIMFYRLQGIYLIIWGRLSLLECTSIWVKVVRKSKSLSLTQHTNCKTLRNG